MINEELKRYIHTLLKQGYTLDEIKKILKQAGHDITEVEKISLMVFEVFHKGLLQYMEAEIRKGRKLDDVKSDLLKIGHSEKKLKDIASYHRKYRRQKGLFSGKGLKDAIESQQNWWKKWVLVYLYLFIIVVLVVLIVTPFILFSEEQDPYIDLNRREDLCGDILSVGDGVSVYYHHLCLAIVHEDSILCADLGNPELISKCESSFSLYMFYKASDAEHCQKIENANLKEYCFQLSDKNCNEFFGYGNYCDSIIGRDVAKCSPKIAPANQRIIESCQDNFRLYSAIKKGSLECRGISDKWVYDLCVAISG